MRIRQTIKKAVALGTGALMLGATILGASAANLSDYPSAFVSAGKVTAKIVVGEKAQVIDVVGAIDIAADLQAAAVTKTPIAGSSSTTGAKSDKVAFALAGEGSVGTVFGTLDYYDVAGLVHEKLSWNDKDVDVDEKIDTTGLVVLTSAKDPDFDAKVFLGTNTATAPMAVQYIIKDTDMNVTMIGPEDKSTCGSTGLLACLGNLKVNILGKEFEIQKVTGTGTSAVVTVGTANEYYLAVGESVTVNGKKVTLKNVGSNDAVSVDVDGVIKTVSKTGVTTVNGIKVEISSSFYDDVTASRSATLKIGDKITEDLKTNAKLTQFGEPDSSDAEWEWQINKIDDTNLQINAVFRKLLDGDTKNVRAVGETIATPGNYVSAKISKLTVPTNQEIKVSFDDISIDKNANGTDSTLSVDGKPALKFVSAEEFFKVTGNVDTKEVYLIRNGTTALFGAYLNRDGDVQAFDTTSNGTFQLINDKKSFNITYNDNEAANAGNVIIDGFSSLIAGTGTVTLAANYTAQTFGVTDNEAVSTDMTTANLGATVSGTYDNDFMTDFGVIIKNPKTGFESDEFVFVIPGDQVKAQVDFAGPKAATTTTSGSTSDTVNPIGVDFGVLDKDFVSGSANSIVVGGPCVNTFAAKLAGMPTPCSTGFVEGEAKLAIFDDNGKVALLVAGMTGKDTLSATRALVNEVLPAKASAKVITTNIKQPVVQ